MSVLLALIVVVTVAITMVTVVVTTVHVPRGTLWILMGTALVKNNYNKCNHNKYKQDKINIVKILWLIIMLILAVHTSFIT